MVYVSSMLKTKLQYLLKHNYNLLYKYKSNKKYEKANKL